MRANSFSFAGLGNLLALLAVNSSLSYAFFYNLSHLLFGDRPDPLILQLNENGEKWQSIKDALQILDVEPVSVGGRRKTRKRKTCRSLKKK
jgi:hypothetical protein